MTRSRRSSRRPCCTSRASASPRSASSERSWNSSNSTAATPSSMGSSSDEPRENALGDDFDPGAARDFRAEAHPQARPCRRRASPSVVRHALGGGARGEPARLEHQDAALSSAPMASAREHQRHPRGLAGAGRRHQHGRIVARAAPRSVPAARRRSAAASNPSVFVIADMQRRVDVNCPPHVPNRAKSYITGHHARRTKNAAEAGQSRQAAGQAVEERRPRLPGRRLRLHFPRLSRAAADQPQVGRPAAQCRVRLLQHAVEASARHEAGGQADPSRGGVRPVGEDVPHRNVSRLQGAPAGSAGRSAAAIPAHPRSGAGLRSAVPGAGGLRGRRPDRDLCARGLRGRRHRDHRLLGQGSDAARQRLRRSCSTP